MTQYEKTIKGLKYLHDVKRWSPDESEENITARRNITGDALALLKAQEPVEPKKVNRYIDFDGEGHPYNPETYDCGACGKELPWKANYCPECGRKVKWNG